MTVTMSWFEYRHLGFCRVDGRPVHLTPQELELVSILIMARPGNYIPYVDMIERMWPDPDIQPETARTIISVYVIRLRKKLGKDAIQTYYGYGIRLKRDEVDHPVAGELSCLP